LPSVQISRQFSNGLLRTATAQLLVGVCKWFLATDETRMEHGFDIGGGLVCLMSVFDPCFIRG
jgi:hypothetical protein